MRLDAAVALLLFVLRPAAAGPDFETLTPAAGAALSCAGAMGCLLPCLAGGACENTSVACAADKPCWVECANASSCAGLEVTCPTTATCTVKCAADACPSPLPPEVDCFGPGCPAGSAGDYDKAPGPFGESTPFGRAFCAYTTPPSLPAGAVVSGPGCEPYNFVPDFSYCQVVKDGRFCELPLCWFGKFFGLDTIECNECLHETSSNIPRYFVQCADGTVCDIATKLDCCDQNVRCSEDLHLCADSHFDCADKQCCSMDCTPYGGNAPCETHAPPTFAPTLAPPTVPMTLDTETPTAVPYGPTFMPGPSPTQAAGKAPVDGEDVYEEETRDTVTGSVIIGLGSSGGAGSSGTRLALLAENCHSTGNQNLPVALHPLQFEIQGSQAFGAVAGNLGVTVVVSLVYFTVVRAAAVLIKKVAPTAIPEDVSGFFRFPSAPLFVMTVLYQGTSLACFLLLFFPPNEGARALGVCVGLLCFALPCWGFQHVVAGVRGTKDRGPKGVYRLETKPRGRLYKFMMGPGEWVCTHPGNYWTYRYAALMFSFRPAVAWWFVIDLLSCLALSGIATLPTHSFTQCAHSKLASAFVMGVVFAATLGVRPFVRSRDNYLTCCHLLMQVLALIFLSISLYSDDITDWAAVLSDKLILGATGVIIFKAICDVVSAVIVLVTGRRDKLQCEEWRAQGVLPEDMSMSDFDTNEDRPGAYACLYNNESDGDEKLVKKYASSSTASDNNYCASLPRTPPDIVSPMLSASSPQDSSEKQRRRDSTPSVLTPPTIPTRLPPHVTIEEGDTIVSNPKSTPKSEPFDHTMLAPVASPPLTPKGMYSPPSRPAPTLAKSCRVASPSSTYQREPRVTQKGAHFNRSVRRRISASSPRDGPGSPQSGAEAASPPTSPVFLPAATVPALQRRRPSSFDSPYARDTSSPTLRPRRPSPLVAVTARPSAGGAFPLSMSPEHGPSSPGSPFTPGRERGGASPQLESSLAHRVKYPSGTALGSFASENPTATIITAQSRRPSRTCKSPPSRKESMLII
ncbi:hypothetical protein DIPPA_23904 [Diplonema papillatum]|nr:hypothetical protein DIPPA_23904 [Diplonema papillatum]